MTNMRDRPVKSTTHNLKPAWHGWTRQTTLRGRNRCCSEGVFRRPRQRSGTESHFCVGVSHQEACALQQRLACQCAASPESVNRNEPREQQQGMAKNAEALFAQLKKALETDGEDMANKFKVSARHVKGAVH